MIAPQAMALQAGTQLGPYQLVSVIGAGGMGVVYRARDTRLDRIVALKILENLPCNAERRRRFEREARIVSKLSHPSICVLHDVGQEGGIDFLVMEYLEGESLAERLRRGAVPVPEVLRYAIQIVDGLARAHQNGIVHRDLKPGNIMVTRDGVAKVLDFGVATMTEAPAFEELGTTESDALQPRTQEGQIVGTVAYMSPEQAQGLRVDARSDIFSIGVLLYELVTGQRPFRGETRLATLSLILHHEPASIRMLAPDLPVSLDKAIVRCMAKDPSQRFQYIIELKAALERVTAEWDARGQPTHDRLVAPKQARRLADEIRRWSFQAVAFVILAGVLVLAIMFYREREQNKNLRLVAAEAFYQMRALDADLVGLRQRGSSSSDLARASYRRDQIERDYDHYLDLVGSYAGKSPTEKAVMRLARRLGETDLDVPPGFYTLSMKYVDGWRATPRLRRALSLARQGNLIQRIRSALARQALPSELSFVPLQESAFNIAAVGPRTPAGIPKGLWQFTPTLAKEYGLRLGPLSDTPNHDPLDDRYDVDRSTEAAVRYLADLYSSKAAASGLLVIASYNLGPGRVIEKLDELPNDPRDRSFWNFYRHNWLPDEALAFVMNVFTGALICQQPDLFDMPIEPC